MKISILTLFPSMFSGPFDESIVKRAQKNNNVNIDLVDIRGFATDNYKTVDDKPYGGGKGMVMRVDILHAAIESTIESDNQQPTTNNQVVLLDPKGTTFTQKKAIKYSQLNHLILICGHYEGVDARIEHFIDESVSIGNYVLTGGEIPAMVITDSVVRLLPGVLDPMSTAHESFSPKWSEQKDKIVLEYPHYTRPDEYKGHKVPDVLLSGNHAKIEKWRKKHQTLVPSPLSF